MIRKIIRHVRILVQALEAGRREVKQADRIAYQGDTWPAAKWNREYRRWQRLYRVACARSPWHPLPHEMGA